MGLTVSGIVVAGHRVASGPSKDYPYGSLERQIPLFKQRGLDLQGFFRGTLNISIAPKRFSMLQPEFTFRGVTWTDLHPPEDFSFSRCTVRFRQVEYGGMIYYPHPETKIRNFQNPSLIEVLAPPIPDLQPGDRVELEVNPREIGIFE